jgi:hypothetical protein
VRIGKLRRYLTDERAKLTLASTLIQLANFGVLLVAKTAMPDADFAFLLTQLAIAGILGAITSLRFEVLVYQAHGRMIYAATLIPVAATFFTIALSFVGVEILNLMRLEPLSLSPLVIPMIAGLSLSAILNFTLVQVKEMNALLTSRAAQAVALLLLTIALPFANWTPSGQMILLLVGLGYALPAAVSMGLFLIRSRPRNNDPPMLYLPDFGLIKRALSLTVSTGVNSIYVNLPVLAASASQSATFVADFGLIMRAFTAPITLIGQVIGRLFLAEALRWSLTPERSAATLKRLISRAMQQSVGTYLVMAPLLVGMLYLARGKLNISHMDLAAFLFFAAIGQSAVNPVVQVRIALGDERAFLILDAVRLVALAVGLYGLALVVPFEMAFTGTALVLYLSYIAFIYMRVSRYAAP